MGEKTTAKVNLLDEWHVACWFLDPFGHLLPHLPAYTGQQRTLVMQNTIKFFIPGESEAEKTQRKECMSTFTQFYLQTGEFSHYFETRRRPALNAEEATFDAKKLTLKMVDDWINESGGHNTRIEWWKLRCESTVLYKKVVSPLLSTRTTGSITVERAAKTIKNNVCIPIRNRLRSEKASLIMRVGWNLKLLHAAGVDTRQLGKM